MFFAIFMAIWGRFGVFFCLFFCLLPWPHYLFDANTFAAQIYLFKRVSAHAFASHSTSVNALSFSGGNFQHNKQAVVQKQKGLQSVTCWQRINNGPLLQTVFELACGCN